MSTQTGLEHLIEAPPAWIQGKRLGLLGNPASVDSRFRHARQLIQQKFPGQLRALYSPQHGFFAEKQDNMIESDHLTDGMTGLPVYSLYGTTRVPTAEMLDPIDLLLVDLQDVGTRVYTFIYTLSYCMEAAQTHGKTVAVLDRPNPINGRTIEGNLLKPPWASFVGRFPIPMRHGLTIAELARLFNQHFGIGCDLQIMPLQGWTRDMFFPQTGLPWIPPSPNLPTFDSALVYPGQVIWEGTNISEGRGTAQPFELFGAPFLNTESILADLGGKQVPGAILRELVFEPTSNKWQGQPCRGFQIHVTDPDRFRPYETSLRLLQAVIAHHPEAFAWKSPPYEYEYERLPMDLILGDPALREGLQAATPMERIKASWRSDLAEFDRIRKTCFLY